MRSQAASYRVLRDKMDVVARESSEFVNAEISSLKRKFERVEESLNGLASVLQNMSTHLERVGRSN